MLPLDKLSVAAVQALQECGRSPESLSIALRMDQNIDGTLGEAWLLYDSENKVLVRLIADPSSIDTQKYLKHNHDKDRYINFGKNPPATIVHFQDELSFAYYSDMNVDNFAYCKRLTMKKHDTPRPNTEGLSKEETEKILDQWNQNAQTIVIARGSNDRRNRIVAFRDIVERLFRGEEVKEDDPVFDAFNRKCPHCGKVFDNPRLRICKDCRKIDNPIPRLLGFLKPFRKQAIITMASMITYSVFGLLPPLLTGQILYEKVIDSEGQWHSLDKLFIVLTAIFGVAVIQLGLDILQHRANAELSNRFGGYLKKKVFRAMMRQSFRFFNKESTGALMHRVNYDADIIKNFFVSYMPSLVINSLTLVGLTFFMFWLNWKMTLIVFIPVPVIFVLFRVYLPKLNRMYSELHRSFSKMNSVLAGSLSGIRVVKSFGKETDETSRFRTSASKVYKANLRANLLALTLFPVVSLMLGLSSQAIWGYGGLQVLGQHMSYGDFTSYLGYAGMIFGPLQFFATLADQTTSLINSSKRMFEVLDMEPEIVNAPNAVEMPSMQGNIEFKNVNFHYDPERAILKDINLKIHAGDNIGIVGHTGSGKSTLANLITRMYDTISGTITIDGVDIKKIELDSLRRNVAIVSQETFIFRGTIADNIRYARPDATMEEIIAAAKAANAHDFILQMPEAYETLVGTGARSLSGGERQRVSIARALLTSPSLLILDEATAAMDTETERLINNALTDLSKGRTCISIAHRLSTLKDCNYLFAIENGEIAEEGTPEELLAKKGVYYKLYTLQSAAMKKVISGI